MPLITCPDCHREVSDAAPSCPGCGRQLLAQVVAPEARRSSGGWGCVLVGLGLAGAASLAALAFCGMAMNSNLSARPEKAATKSAASSRADTIRVLRENHAPDDPARAYMFRELARKANWRCDSVESAIMGAPGSWTIDCAPGYRYRLAFDAAGQPIEAVRLK